MEQSRNNEDLRAEVTALKADLLAVRGDVKNVTGSLLNRGKESALHAKDAIANATTESIDKTKQCVQEHPIQSVLIAFGAGLLIGAVVVSLRHR